MRSEQMCCCQVTATLERILADVQPGPAAAPVWGLEQQQQESAFNTANAAVQPPVYFSPAAYEALAGLYGRLQGAINAAAPPPADPKKGQKAVRQWHACYTICS